MPTRRLGHGLAVAVLAVAVLAVATGCGSNTAEPTVSGGTRPPGFGGAGLQRGVPVEPEGEGLDAVTLWELSAYPGSDGPLTDEQFVRQPLRTDSDDAAVGIRGGAFCYLTPSVSVATTDGRAVVTIDSYGDEELLAMDIPCPASETLLVVAFDVADGVSALTVDGVEVPLRDDPGRSD